MENSEALQAAEAFACARLAGDASGHDAHHLRRVHAMAVALAGEEGADAFVVAMAAWLHDVADAKLNADPAAAESELRVFLRDLGLRSGLAERIAQAAGSTSYSAETAREARGEAAPELSLEARVVRDADRLDALGAIGVARCFAFGGSRGRSLYDPGSPQASLASLAHFEDKLLRLRDRFTTEAGRRQAEIRHRRTERFYREFLDEWEGPR